MEDYNASQIQILEGLKAVRKVPGMYIGSTDDRGLHHLIYEVVDNSIDESAAGYCSNISITLEKDGWIVIEDDGRGVPVDLHPKYNRPALEIVLTELHSGAKFDKKVYKITGGLHGVGVHVVNALSSKLIALVKKNSDVYYEIFREGIPVDSMINVPRDQLSRVPDADVASTEINLSPEHGFIVKFQPDSKIFETTQVSYSVVLARLRELSFLNPQITITIDDRRTGKHEILHHEGGLTEFVSYLGEGYSSVHKEPISYREDFQESIVEFAFQYNTGTTEIMQSFVNNINTIDGGTHVAGFRSGLSRAIQDYAKSNNMIKGVEAINGDDVREGLVSVLHVKIHQPQFEGQTKSKLGNANVRGIVQSVTEKFMKQYMDSFPHVAETIVKRVIAAAMAREASRKARDLVRRKSALESGGLPGILADCSSSDPEKSELFIVEGNSAGGSAKQARNREFQAILPLRGKILNVEKANDLKSLSNEIIKNLITALGTNVKDDLDPEKLRYRKIIIMTDADVDGAHIRTLLLTFFYRYCRPLVQSGNIFFAQPPLFRIQKGDKVRYVYTEEERESAEKEMGQNFITQRFKGLGEMNPEQLWETTMDPETRRVVQVTVDDTAEADRLFSILMGEKVEPRKRFIEENAREVKNLDL
ncbi:MAG: type IIA DNA topoisomerase subunit B [Candidatus Thermoplasmatota archaeon]|jgi:DNA gyrase subunit B|nr:type IIA DNA topoisomerase subunit B [Candidatus Thermoplasmatota archaeon]MCL5793809.1 type IIA DNA topoisomerase subunit B [Candidatus Thermoplasmatota archaeon]